MNPSPAAARRRSTTAVRSASEARTPDTRSGSAPSPLALVTVGDSRTGVAAPARVTDVPRVSALLERRPGQQQALLADVGEADRGLGLVARTLDVDDHAVAEGGVVDVVADLQPER